MKRSRSKLRKFVAPIAGAFLACALGSTATADEYEYERGQGLHEEEWYDPSDWVDANDGVDYEYDWDYDWSADRDYDFDDYGNYGYYDRAEYPSYPYTPYYNWTYDPGYRVGSVVYWTDQDRNNRDRNQQARNRSNDRRQNQRMNNRNERVRVYGTIEKLDQVEVFGTTHQVAKVSTYGGNEVMVDLGPKNELSKLNLKEGQSVTVRGQREMVAAATIEANDQTVNIDRDWSNDQQRMRQLTGTIDTLRTRTVNGNKKLVAHIESRNGNIRKVCLGEKSELNDLNLDEGDRIRVRGHDARMDGKRYFVAKKVQKAKRQSNNDRNRNNRSWNRDNDDRQSANRQGLRGEIDSVRNMKIDGEKQTVITLETENGDIQRVCLGSVAQTEDLNLQSGDEIRVTGSYKKIDGRRYYVADNVRTRNDSSDRWSSRDLTLVQ